MANIAITAANLIPAEGYSYQDGIAGATFVPGDVAYTSAVNGQFLLADNNDTAVKAAVTGIALTAAVAGQPLRLRTGGTAAVGAVLTLNDAVYCLSSDAGKICPYSDLGSGDYVSIIGVPLSTSSLRVAIRNSGIQKP
jgi:hypothetical protein